MKRLISFIILTLLIVNTFVIVLAAGSSEDLDLEKIREELDAINTEEIKSEFGAIAGDLDAKTENVLTREVKMKEPLNKIIRSILGINDSDYLSIEKMVLYSGIWLIFLIIFIPVLTFIPALTETPKVKVAVAIIVTILTSISGGMFYLIDLIVSFLDFLPFADIAPARIFFGAVILAALIWGANKLAGKFSDKVALQGGADLGDKLNMHGKIAETASKSLTD